MTEHHCVRCEEALIPIAADLCEGCIEDLAGQPDYDAPSAAETQARVNEEAYGPGGYKR